VLELGNRGALVLLTGFQTPAALRELSVTELEAWLRSRKVRGAGKLAAVAVAAATAQTVRLPGEQLAARLIADLAEGVLALDGQAKEIDELLEGRFRRHPAAAVICSLPGVGVLLGAEFLAITGGDLAAFGTPDRLASLAALVAAARRCSSRVRHARNTATAPTSVMAAMAVAIMLSSLPRLCRYTGLRSTRLAIATTAGTVTPSSSAATLRVASPRRSGEEIAKVAAATSGTVSRK
jgi:Transposase IS116/IS110/IS902 family